MRQARRLYQHEIAPVALPEAAFALDASLIHLSARLFPWATSGQRSHTAIKLHLLLALRGNLPAWATCTDGPFPEVKMLETLPAEPGCFYVMDRGYLDFGRLRRITQQQAYFVVRARSRCDFIVRQSQAVDKSTGLRCDQTIHLHYPRSQRAYPERLRRVRVWDEVNQKSLVLLTNHFVIPAQSVALLYRRRWQIELFFKWIKQHLSVRGFLGHTPNAVQCQLWSAICVYLLVAILKKKLELTHSLHEILQILSLHPFEQSPIKELLMKTQTEIKTDENQKLLDFNML
jgi:IS4 transposase